MKKILLPIVTLMLLTLPLASQNLVSSFMNDVGSEAKENVMQITISGRILRLAGKSDESIDTETRELFQNIDKISAVIQLATDRKTKVLLAKHLAPYEELLSVTENGQSIQMFTKETKGKVDEFVLCITAANNLTLMSITGKIDLDKIAKLASGVQLQGMEHLEKIETSKSKKK